MIEKHLKLKCDIEENSHNGLVETKKVPVMFDHDQEDGKSKEKPYFELLEIEMCGNCWKSMIENGRLIYAYGAMGYNKYYLTYKLTV